MLKLRVDIIKIDVETLIDLAHNMRMDMVAVTEKVSGATRCHFMSAWVSAAMKGAAK